MIICLFSHTYLISFSDICFFSSSHLPEVRYSRYFVLNIPHLLPYPSAHRIFLKDISLLMFFTFSLPSFHFFIGFPYCYYLFSKDFLIFPRFYRYSITTIFICLLFQLLFLSLNPVHFLLYAFQSHALLPCR